MMDKDEMTGQDDSIRLSRVQVIKAALPLFIGRKNFRSFQGAKATVKSTVREIYSADLVTEDSELYRIGLVGNGFLKQMVRSIVGTLVEIGEGKREPQNIVELFEANDRRLAGRTLPPQGLFLVEIHYPEYCMLGAATK